MKPYTILLSLMIAGCQSTEQQPATPADSTQPIAEKTYVEEDTKSFREVFSYDINHDGKPDTITISTDIVEVGTFERFELALTDGDRQTFEGGPWDTIDADFLKHHPNDINNPLFYVQQHDDEFIIMLLGYPYGSGREDFNIIRGKGPHFKMILDDRHLDSPVKLQNNQLIARRGWIDYYGMTEIDGDTVSLGTYAPFTVFDMTADTVIENEVATRAYNEQNYIWLGKNDTDSLKIYYYRDNRKPLVR